MSHKVITFHYALSDSDGQPVESSQGRDPLTFMSGMGMIVPGLERELVNYTAGQKGHVEVKAEDGYGLIDFNKFVQVPREALPKEDIKEGDIFQTHQSPVPFVVKQVGETHITLDGNHPLAGEDLVFDIEVLETRDASEQELQQLQEMMDTARQEMERQMTQPAEEKQSEQGKKAAGE